jgi:hypothetical protein
MLDVGKNLGKAVGELRRKYDKFLIGDSSGTRADDRIQEQGTGQLPPACCRTLWPDRSGLRCLLPVRCARRSRAVWTFPSTMRACGRHGPAQALRRRVAFTTRIAASGRISPMLVTLISSSPSSP